MQDYGDIALKNGISLYSDGPCQFCGAKTQNGVHECLEIVSLGFPLVDISKPNNQVFLFMSVDAHALQHPEIHGRWSNHFHLTRLHLIFYYSLNWNYNLSPKLSNYLNKYKAERIEEYLQPPAAFERGKITTAHILTNSSTEVECKNMIRSWAEEVYYAWSKNHEIVNAIAKRFLKNGF